MGVVGLAGPDADESRTGSIGRAPVVVGTEKRLSLAVGDRGGGDAGGVAHGNGVRRRSRCKREYRLARSGGCGVGDDAAAGIESKRQSCARRGLQQDLVILAGNDRRRGVDDLHRAVLRGNESRCRVGGGEVAEGGRAPRKGHAVVVDRDAGEGELPPGDKVLPHRRRGVVDTRAGVLDAVPAGDQPVLDV